MHEISIIRLLRTCRETDSDSINSDSIDSGSTSLHPSRLGLLSSLFILMLGASQLALAQAIRDEESFALERTDMEQDYYALTITDPFIELHTGPNAGYPIFYIVERGEEIHVISRKTNWFKIETSNGKTGWVSRDQMRQTLLPSGEAFQLVELGEDDFAGRRWVAGVTAGGLDSAPVFTLFGGYSITENLSVELALGQSIGTDSSSRFVKGNLLMHPFPDFTYSPYMALGIGLVEVKTSTTLIAANSDTNTFAQVGLGIQTYISRSFLLRIEANEYVVFSTSSTGNDNEVLNEWKIGFAVFY